MLHVTNLNDSGPAVCAMPWNNPARAPWFGCLGLITLESRLIIRSTNSNLTIAGQTAPSHGICLRKYKFWHDGRDQRYHPLPPSSARQSLGSDPRWHGHGLSDNCIIDHCSISWTLDESFSSRGAKTSRSSARLISEALNDAGQKYPPATRLRRQHQRRRRQLSSQSPCLTAPDGTGSRRWPQQTEQRIRHRLDLHGNNVVYNWKSRATDGGARKSIS